MTDAEQRAERLGNAVQFWLNDDSGKLQKAVDATVSEGLFLRDDVVRALEHIRNTVTIQSLKNWVRGNTKGITKYSNKGVVLCLHAGNLPLVGIQDVLAVLLSGYEYAGKLSRKDPYLMKSLLEHLEKNGSFSKMRSSTNLEDFQNLGAHAVMFSGSEQSVPEVRNVLAGYNVLASGAQELIRTAHSSVAWIGKEHDTKAAVQLLVEAIFAYEGKGCRSLTTIFTDSDSRSMIGNIAKEAGASPYIQKCISPKKLSPALIYKRSFFTAVDRRCITIGDKLLFSGDPDPHTEGIVTITEAGMIDCITYVEKNRAKIQSLYTVSNSSDYANIPVESLHRAQRPPVDWKPDGTDPLRWLALLEQSPGLKV